MKEYQASDFVKRMKLATAWSHIARGSDEVDKKEQYLNEVFQHTKVMTGRIVVVVSNAIADDLSKAKGFQPVVTDASIDDASVVKPHGELLELSYYHEGVLLNIYKTEMLRDHEILIYGDGDETIKMSLW